jgi:hypothetical protein
VEFARAFFKGEWRENASEERMNFSFLDLQNQKVEQ